MILLINLFKKYRALFLALAVAVIIFLLTWMNFQYVKDNPGGYDFYTNWHATRNYFFEGINPYSEQNRLDVQNLVYGRAALTNEDQFRFSIPLYGMLLYSPFALISNFIMARAIWMSFLEIALFVILFLSIKLTWWKINRSLLIPLIIFSFLGLHGIITLLNGGLIIPITLIALALLYAIQNKQDEATGLLLALMTIFPIPVGLFGVLILIRLGVNRRFKAIWWMLGCLGLLIGFSIALIPEWILQFLVNLINAFKELNPGSPGSVLVSRWGAVGNRFSIIISVIVGLLLLFEWWQAAKAGDQRFLWAALLTLALGTWSGIKVSPLDYVLLYPGLIMGFALLYERWKNRSTGTILLTLALLFLSNWAIYLLTMSADFKPGISSYLFIPLPFTVIGLLYWSKWWVKKSNSVELESTMIELKRP